MPGVVSTQTEISVRCGELRLTLTGASALLETHAPPIACEYQQRPSASRRPRRIRLVGRDDLLARLASSQPHFFGIAGGAGIGKTALLHRVWSEGPGKGEVDGAHYLSASGLGPHDLLRAIWDRFFVAEDGIAPTQEEMATGMASRQALLLVDDLDLPPGEIERLLGVLPNCRVRAALQARADDERAIQVGGLSTPDAVDLLRRSAGAVATRDQGALHSIAELLDGHPGRLIQAGALIRERVVSPSEVASRIQTADRAASRLGRDLVAGLDELERELVVLLAIAEQGFTEEQLAVITGQAPAALERSCEHLIRLCLATNEFNRIRLVGGVRDEVEHLLSDVRRGEKAVDQVATFLSALQGDPHALLAEVGNAFGVFEWAANHEEWATAITISHMTEEALVLYGRFESWKALLERTLTAAEHLGDRAEQVATLRKLAVSSRLTGKAKQADKLLREADRLEHHARPSQLRRTTSRLRHPGLASRHILLPTVIGAGGFLLGGALALLAARTDTGVAAAGTVTTVHGPTVTLPVTRTVTHVSVSVDVKKQPTLIPINTAIPTLSPGDGTLSVVPGTWTLSPTLTEQWQTCTTDGTCTNIPVSGSTLPTAAYQGQLVRVLETAASTACTSPCQVASAEWWIPSLA